MPVYDSVELTSVKINESKYYVSSLACFMVSVCILITIAGDCMRHSVCEECVVDYTCLSATGARTCPYRYPATLAATPAATAAVIRVYSNHKHSTGSEQPTASDCDS